MSPISTTPALKISYCITCKGRLYHLKRTLPLNLASELKDLDVEFVILNYQSDDGLAEWIKATYPLELASGRLVHAYHSPAPHFKMAHAKNLAHRLSSGDILCNLDADNILPAGYASWLRTRFTKSDDIVISSRRVTPYGFAEERILRRLLRLPVPKVGTHGRIAIRRKDFYRLGGYNESYSGWGGDDIDLLLRARQIGIKPVTTPSGVWGDVIEHGPDERIGNLSAEDRKVSLKQLDGSFIRAAIHDVRRFRQHYDPTPNKDGRFGMGRININFGLRTEKLGPASGSDGDLPLRAVAKSRL